MFEAHLNARRYEMALLGDHNFQAPENFEEIIGTLHRDAVDARVKHGDVRLVFMVAM
jgi:hypothetical protein